MSKAAEAVMQSNVTQQRVPIHGDRGPWVHVSESPRHVRVFFGDEAIADSKRVKLVRESDTLPVYYFPKEDVRTDLFVPSAYRTECPLKGEASYWSVRSGGKSAENAAWCYSNPTAVASVIKDHFAFDWPKMDKWMEEDEELYKHARDPFKRVDALPSKRHVRVAVDGKTVADTRRPHLVFETNHPVRYYIPQEDVRMDMLAPSATKSRCPYKGEASYWDVKLGGEIFADLVWGYMDPIPETPKIKGLLCFFHERGCEIYVDGELIPQPKTKWASALR
ncbi:MAG TPA: DUF427 domain-containing protein [Verrucomicrobiae bacterium]|nr:DUF427 domain-containing protein [Verrucomicrobiae bacterium]